MARKPKPQITEKLPVGTVYRGILRGYVRDWRVLLVAGLLIFLPVGVLEAAIPADLDIDQADDSVILLILAAMPLEIILHVLGTVLYTGVVAAGERRARSTETESVSEMLGDLPLKTLIIADIALIAVLLGGFIALIIPGFLFTIWFALVAPVIEIERLGVRAAFRRSRRLIHAQFWRCAAVVLPVIVIQASVEQFGHDLGITLLGHNFAGDAAAAVAANALGASLVALTAVVLYYELTPRHREIPEPAEAAA